MRPRSRAFAEDLKAHGANPEAIESISIDMSPAFIEGVKANLPNATITFDKFHDIAQVATKRTARLALQGPVARNPRVQADQRHARHVWQWTVNVMRSKVEPMKDVAKMIRKPLEGIVVAWTRTRQTNGFLEAINGLFQAAKRRVRGYSSFSTIRTTVFLLAGKLDFGKMHAT